MRPRWVGTYPLDGSDRKEENEMKFPIHELIQLWNHIIISNENNFISDTGSWGMGWWVHEHIWHRPLEESVWKAGTWHRVDLSRLRLSQELRSSGAHGGCCLVHRVETWPSTRCVQTLKVSPSDLDPYQYLTLHQRFPVSSKPNIYG